MTITNSTLSGNEVVDSGGGVWNYRGSVTLTGTLVAGNTAPTGPEFFNKEARSSPTTTTCLAWTAAPG